MKPSLTIAVLILLLTAQQQSKALHNNAFIPATSILSVTNVADTSVAPNYGDLNVFWSDFKKYALANNTKKLAALTAFKFMDQNNMITKEEFLTDFSFAAPMKGLRKAALPKYTKDKHYDYDSNKYLGHAYTAVVGGTLLLFCKIKGQWKFTGISYGE